MSAPVALELPSSISCSYFAEGAANIVYRVHLTNEETATPPTEADLHNVPNASSRSTPPPTSISPPASPSLEPSKSPIDPTLRTLLQQPNPPLLRLKKALPHLPTVQAQFQNFTHGIAPLLPQYVLPQQTLVTLPPNLLQTLNDHLKSAEDSGARPANRHGIYLAPDESHGILIEDLSPRPALSEVGLEFKTKWLTRSPSAPEGARRCRTCALRAQRAAGDAGAEEKVMEGHCPLDLVSDHRGDVERAVRRLLDSRANKTSGQFPDGLIKTLTSFLHNHIALRTLRDFQAQLDPTGVLALDETQPVPEDFLKAMTLRDCTLFLRVGADGKVDAKLGDLDLKQPDSGKLRYWEETERGLVEGGWYHGEDGWRSGCLLGG